MNPKIVSRAAAGLVPPKSPYNAWRPGQPTGKVGHWEGAGGQTNHAMCAAEWRSIQRFHMNKDYIDIAYHYGICQHGVIFEGRPVNVESAAQNDGNHYYISIVYMGGPQTPFTQAGREAYAFLLRKHGGKNLSHRDVPGNSTACAGDVISHFIYNENEWPKRTHRRPAPAPKPLPLPQGGVKHPTLSRGAVGPAVMELQQKLNRVSGARLAPDGNFGPATQKAVRNFQRFFRLTVDGIAGPQTWGLLDYINATKR